MNILTFDIEEWFLEQHHLGRREKYAEYDAYLEKILDKLDERQQKATFFCVGEMGETFPEVIRKIQRRGHEIGCHSNVHTWLNKMSEAECREDTHAAVCRLEQCIGEKVYSYRSPAFSIGESNLWAFDILAENGITRDSSVFPAKRDFGGFPNFGSQKPCVIQHNGVSLKEFPIPMTSLLGKQLAYSGGGYFRFFPLWYVKSKIKKEDYSMTYFHIDDLEVGNNPLRTKEEYEDYFHEPGTVIARYKRYFKANFKKKHAFEKLSKLLESTDFLNLMQVSDIINWNEAPVVNL